MEYFVLRILREIDFFFSFNSGGGHLGNDFFVIKVAGFAWLVVFSG
jgi:hypothetical protein